MILLPILYVSDMPAAIASFEALGFEIEVQSRTAGWTELRDGRGALLALHLDEPGRAGTLELSMVAEEPLEALATRVPVRRGIADESYGRSLVLTGPDDVAIQVNEHDRSLYT